MAYQVFAADARFPGAESSVLKRTPKLAGREKGPFLYLASGLSFNLLSHLSNDQTLFRSIDHGIWVHLLSHVQPWESMLYNCFRLALSPRFKLQASGFI